MSLPGPQWPVGVGGPLAAALSLTYIERKSGISLASTNANVVRYTVPVASVGADVTATDSPTLGTYFTVVTPGLYLVWIMCRFGVLKSASIRSGPNVHGGTLNYTSETDLRSMTTTSDGSSSFAPVKAAAGDKIWVALSGAGNPSNLPDHNRIAILGPLPLAAA